MPIEFKKEESEKTESVDASAILAEAKSKLSELEGLIAKSDSDDDKAKISSITSQLSELEESLGYSPEEESKPVPVGRVTAEAGSKNVKPVY